MISAEISTTSTRATRAWLTASGQREADAEAADQDLRRGGVTAGERRRDHEPFGPAVPGVHEEHAVADDLEVRARPAEDQLPAPRDDPLQHLGPAVGGTAWPRGVQR
jgi:hypothetical protein